MTSTPGPEHPSNTHPCEDIRGLQANSNTNSQPVRGGAMWERTERENQTVQGCSQQLDSPKVEITQTPVNGRIDKQIAVSSCNGLKWE